MPTKEKQQIERGDIVVVGGRRVGTGARMGEIVDVLGDPDHPHFAVRWEDGHVTILYPGETTTVTRKAPAEASAPRPETERLIELLREAGLEFELLPHPRTLSAESEARALGVLPQVVAKTLVARDDGDTCIRALVPASARLDLEKLARAVDAEWAVLLSEEELMASYPQFELGAVPPFGGPAGDLTVIDRELADTEHVVFEGGVHDASLRMRTTDLIKAAAAELADIAVTKEES